MDLLLPLVYLEAIFYAFFS